MGPSSCVCCPGCRDASPFLVQGSKSALPALAPRPQVQPPAHSSASLSSAASDMQATAAPGARLLALLMLVLPSRWHRLQLRPGGRAQGALDTPHAAAEVAVRPRKNDDSLGRSVSAPRLATPGGRHQMPTQKVGSCFCLAAVFARQSCPSAGSAPCQCSSKDSSHSLCCLSTGSPCLCCTGCVSQSPCGSAAGRLWCSVTSLLPDCCLSLPMLVERWLSLPVLLHGWSSFPVLAHVNTARCHLPPRLGQFTCAHHKSWDTQDLSQERVQP